jgi:hypothetical protein
MCEGTDLMPYKCVNYLLDDKFCDTPTFAGEPSSYQFALAIVEGRPVFEGDKLYDHEGSGFTVSSAGIKNDYQSRCTWNPPRKTITVTIPRPSDYGFSMSRLTLYFKDSLAQAEADNVFKEAMK